VNKRLAGFAAAFSIALAAAGCGARSSLRAPDVRGAGGGTSSASMSSSASGTGGGSVCVPVVGPAQFTGRVRDFHTAHPDFEKFAGDDPGIVEPELGADGEPVYAHPGGTTDTTTGQADFDAWYHDTPGVNEGVDFNLQLSPVPGGFEVNNDMFFPIDDQLFGNEGDTHNFHFTMEGHTHFQFHGGEVFSFSGDDDLWAFIDDKLAIDLGGVHPTEGSQVNLDSLGLTPGSVYPLDIFFAERHTSGSTISVSLLGFDLCQ
jgi:fibro-slime domain-containing protein